MVYQKDYGNDSSKELLYDLRQKLAEQLGYLRERIIDARLKRDYPTWYFLLDSLFIEITKKLSEPEIKEFDALMKKVNEKIKENPNAYTNAYTNKVASDDIYLALREMDIWLNKKMEKYKMFGSRDMDDGL